MATKYLERNSDFPAPVGDTAGNVTPIYVDSDDSKVKFYDRTASVWRTLLDGREPIITPTAAAELTAAQTGSQIMLNAAAGFAITLPLPAAGLRYRFTVAAAFATTNFTVVTNGSANIIEGSINVAGAIVDADARDVITFVATAENIGDFVEVWSDGTSWFVFGNALTAGGITFGQT
jgi:hypothetical protein